MHLREKTQKKIYIFMLNLINGRIAFGSEEKTVFSIFFYIARQASIRSNIKREWEEKKQQKRSIFCVFSSHSSSLETSSIEILYFFLNFSCCCPLYVEHKKSPFVVLNWLHFCVLLKRENEKKIYEKEEEEKTLQKQHQTFWRPSEKLFFLLFISSSFIPFSKREIYFIFVHSEWKMNATVFCFRDRSQDWNWIDK